MAVKFRCKGSSFSLNGKPFFIKFYIRKFYGCKISLQRKDFLLDGNDFEKYILLICRSKMQTEASKMRHPINPIRGIGKGRKRKENRLI